MQEILYMNVNILESQTMFDKGMSMISDERKKRIKKLKNPAAARLSLGAGILLQLAMEKSGYGEYKETVDYGTHGKPYLPNTDFYFSLSHSGDFAICAFGDHPVGADLQKIKDSMPKHLEKILSVEEILFLMNLPEEERRKTFFHIWTGKESLIKWDGRGLRIPLNEISFVEQGEMIQKMYFEGNLIYFKYFDFLMPDYAISVCCEINQDIETITEVSINFLTKY